jgi:membrane-associated phospholipid phosphatase
MRPKSLNPYFLAVAFLFLAVSAALAFGWPKGTPELWINRHTHLYSDKFFLYATEIGHGLFFTAVVIVLTFVRISYAAVVAFSGLLCSIVSNALKHLVYADAPRPPKFFEGMQLHFVQGSEILYANSFPSGHTMTAFALCFLLSQLARNQRWGLVYGLLSAAVGLSRVYLLKHFFLDVFIGAIVGMVIAFVAYRLLLPHAEHLDYKLTRKGLVKANREI